MDIVFLIKKELEQSICPIYTQEDMNIDVARFAISIGINSIKNGLTPKEESMSQFTKKQMWSRFKIVVALDENNNNVNKKVNGIKVRSLIREHFEGDCVKWLQHFIKSTYDVEIKRWFLEIVFPLTSRDIAHLPLDWKHLEKYDPSPQLIHFIKEKRGSGSNIDFDELYDIFSTCEERKNAVVGMTLTNTVHTSLNESDVSLFVQGTYKRALEVARFHAASSVSYVVVDYILWAMVDGLSVTSAQVESRVVAENPAFIREYAGLHAIDEEQTDFLIKTLIDCELNISEVMHVIMQIKSDRDETTDFDKYGMDALINWLVVINVYDRKTGLTFENLHSLSMPISLDKCSAKNFRGMFDRYDAVMKLCGKLPLFNMAASSRYVLHGLDMGWMKELDGPLYGLTS